MLTVAVLAGTGLGARVGESSSTEGVRLHVENIPALGLTGFDGTWGRAIVGADGGTVSTDYQNDPDGVKAFASLQNPSGSASGTPSANTWDAVSDPNVFAMSLMPGGPTLLSIATIHTYARCQPPHSPQTQNFLTALVVAGQPVPARIGAPRLRRIESTVLTTGAAIGFPAYGEALLTVHLDQIQTSTPNYAAEARIEIKIDMVLKDKSGNVAYTGPLTNMTLGAVRARCIGGPTPTPTPTISPSNSPEPTVTPKPRPSPTRTPIAPPTDDDHHTTGTDELLPLTGLPIYIPIALALLLLLAGATGVALRRTPRS